MNHKPGRAILIYVILDFCVIIFSFCAAYGIYWGFEPGSQARYGFGEMFSFIFCIAAILLVTYAWRKLYQTKYSLLNIEELQGIVEGTFLGTVIALTLCYLMQYPFSTGMILLGSTILLCLMIAVRSALFHYLSKNRKTSARRTIIYGAGELGTKLYRSLCNSPLLGSVPVAFADDNESLIGKTIYESDFFKRSGIRVVGRGEELPRLVEKLNVDYVIVAISNAPKKRITDTIDMLEKNRISYSYVPHLYHTSFHELAITKIAGIPLATRKPMKVFRSPYLIFKRIFDILISLCLLVCFGPIMVLISLAVRLGSQGPAIFVQERAGYRGKLFNLYKFRTMTVDSDPYTCTPASPADKRIANIVGRWLRKYSIDELPQLWNVLRGDMSLVGPRPEMTFIVDTYDNIQKRRLNIKPGITGLWQISADRGLQIHENIDYDLYYIGHCSFSLDIAILIRTVGSAIRGIGAC